MIDITVQPDKITVSGHAGYAEPGKDIVCAAISTLTQVLIASVEELTAAKIYHAVNSGYTVIDIKESTERAQVLIDSFLLGCEIVAENYPDYVRVLGGKK